MPWALRNGRKYFYVSQRDGDKVRKIYIGGGDIGRAAELTLEVRKERQERVRTWLKETTATFNALDQLDTELVIELSAYMYASTGFHMDAQSARRVLKKQGATMPEFIPQIPLPATDKSTWQDLRLRASRGDREAAEALLPLLELHPLLRSRWGDLSRVALTHWLTLICGQDEVALRAMHAKVIEIVQSLRRDTADPLEELLARRVGLLWLQVHYFDAQVAAAMTRTPREQDYLVTRQTGAQAAYTLAVQALNDFQTGVRRRVRSRPAG